MLRAPPRSCRSKGLAALFAIATATVIAGCTSATSHAGAREPSSDVDQSGMATWYGAAFAGRKTANGERFDPRAMTAAHRTLPFGTWVEVRRVDTGRSVRVRINDRGPWGDKRKVIDVSRAAAEVLDLVGVGAARVEIRVVRGR